MVYIMKQDHNEKRSEGLCLACAKELGIKLPDGLDNVGEMMQNFNDSMQNLLSGDDDTQGKAPMLNFDELNSILFGGRDKKDDGKSDGKKQQKGATKRQENPRKAIDQFCINLTAKAKAGELDKVVGRDKELMRLIRILCRRQKNNPCLIGEPGVGKTAIAESLSQKNSERRRTVPSEK